MKIEIEFEEVEKLKLRISELLTENNRLVDKIKSLDENNITHKALDNANKALFNSLQFIFTELGVPLDEHIHYYNSMFNLVQLHDRFGEDWYKCEDLKLLYTVKTSNLFECAFLNIGYNLKINR